MQNQNNNTPCKKIDSSYKSFPGYSNPMRLEMIGQQKWNILAGDIPLPAAILLKSALKNNASVMQDFLKTTAISFAPHSKTTLSPQLIKQQVADGAWGITVATFQQFYVVWKNGIKRILMANQLIDRASIRSVFKILQQDPQLEFYCLVDSIKGCQELDKAAKEFSLSKPLRVFLELGFKGGRTGCRSIDEALAIAKVIAETDSLQLAGIECYEGLMVTENTAQDSTNVTALLNRAVELAMRCDDKKFFSNNSEIILSAGGSSYFDLVATCFNPTVLSKPTRVVLRSGCYLTHDAKFYEGLFQHLCERSTISGSTLTPALEVWSVVQSRPEPQLAIISLGKRDASHDIDLPIPKKWFSAGKHSSIQHTTDAWKIYKLNDQHGYLHIPEDSLLEVGDLVGCGISHPCTTFDKWKLLYVVDDAYNIVNAITTCF